MKQEIKTPQNTEKKKKKKNPEMQTYLGSILQTMLYFFYINPRATLAKGKRVCQKRL